MTQSEFATEYAIPGRIDLPADGRKVAVALGSLQVPVELHAQVAPLDVGPFGVPLGVTSTNALQLVIGDR